MKPLISELMEMLPTDPIEILMKSAFKSFCAVKVHAAEPLCKIW